MSNGQLYNKEIQVSNYFDIYNFYKKIYGNNVVILMQVGSFFECYATESEGPNIFEIGEKLNFTVTLKNKNSANKTYMMGSPLYTVDDTIDKLINNNYVVIRIDQTTDSPKPKREIMGIFTPSTYIEKNNNDTNNLVSIIFDIISKNNEPLLYIGISSYDINTGKGCVYETINNNDDNMYSMDMTMRFLESYKPKEIIINHNDNFTKHMEKYTMIYNMTLNDIYNYLGINNINNYSSRNLSILKKPNYQISLLNEYFNYKSNINIMDDLNLSYYHMARLSFVILIDFISNNNPLLLDKIDLPTYYTDNEKVFLGNKALEQLDVYGENKSLFNIINNTKTPMGRRYLKDCLNNPTNNINILNERYNYIKLIKNKYLSKDENIFENIYDITKLLRKMVLNKITPNEFYNLYISIIQINKIFNMINNDINIDTNIIKNNEELINFIEENIDLEYIISLNYYNYKEEEYNYMKSNKELDDLVNEIKVGTNFMDYLVKELEKLIEDDKKFMNKNYDKINLKYNDRDGHYLLLTKRRSKILLDGLKKLKVIKIGNKKINVEDLIFEDLPKSNNVKIFCNEMKYISSNVTEIKSELANKIKKEFYNMINNICDKYSDNIKNTSNIISYIDFLFSGAITAKKNGYIKPIIEEKNDRSYFNATQLRHPIVEIISNDNEYKPHDISLGDDKLGILLYGINSSGKSTLMKSIGLNVIMAQIGYYVSAKEYIFYPYKSLFTRICGNDNIYKGMSSFMVEMMELMAILKRNTKNTLVIGDEICRGTEEKSANIIVSYMLEKLENSETSFITATHLHQIAEMNSVKKLKQVIPMHIKVEYDAINQKLIYSRQLLLGQGDKYYGVQVAKFLMKNDDFNNRTKELEEEYENIKIKKSKYNNSIMKNCFICKSKKELETHHINFQKEFNEDGIITDKPHIKKNSNYNTVTLCRTCHDMVDREELVINGYIETSDGKMLDYFFQDKKSKKKFKEDEIEIINCMKNIMTLDNAKKLLKQKHNIRTSKNTISKIWKSNY